MYQKKKKKKRKEKAQLMKVGLKGEICIRKNHNLSVYDLAKL